MSRKDYEAIAADIARSMDRTLSPHAEAVLRMLARDLAGTFEADNPRFDRDRFLVACGVKTA